MGWLFKIFLYISDCWLAVLGSAVLAPSLFMLTVLSFCPSETGLNSEQPLGSDTIQTQEYKKTDLVIYPGPEDYPQ